MVDSQTAWRLAQTLRSRNDLGDLENGDQLIATLDDATQNATPIHIHVDDRTLLEFDHYARIAKRRAWAYERTRDATDGDRQAKDYFTRLSEMLATQGSAPCIQWMIISQDQWSYTVHINAATDRAVVCERLPCAARASDLLEDT